MAGTCIDPSARLAIVTGHGAPVSAPDRDSQAPVYVDLDTGQVWVFHGGTWTLVRAPVDWMKAALAPSVSMTDRLSVNRGGTPGDGDSGTYGVATLRQLRDAVARVMSLADLADVDLAAPKRGEILEFAVDAWRNSPVRLRLAELLDVDVEEADPGQQLVFDGTRWKASVAPLALPDLLDVQVDNARPGMLLVRDGGVWRPAVARVRLGELVDVRLDDVHAGDWLEFDGKVWRNRHGEIPSVRCADCPPDDLEAGDLWLDATTGKLHERRDDGTLVPLAAERLPYVVHCCDSLSIWGLTADGTYVRAGFVSEAVANQVMAVPAFRAPSLSLGEGDYWLDLSGDPVVRRVGSSLCLYPLLVAATNAGACHLFYRGQDGRLHPLRFSAVDVCVSACGNGPITDAMTLQDALCRWAESAEAALVQCSSTSGTPIVNEPLPPAEALCRLDAYWQSLRDALSALTIDDLQISACARGPVSSAMSVQEAICLLSEAVGNLTGVTVTAGDVTVDACAAGPVNAATTAQDALCRLSAYADSITVPGSRVSVEACGKPPLVAPTNVQDAVCQVYVSRRDNRQMSVMDYVVIQYSDDPAQAYFNSQTETVFPGVLDVDLYSPLGIFSIERSPNGVVYVAMNDSVAGGYVYCYIGGFTARLAYRWDTSVRMRIGLLAADTDSLGDSDSHCYNTFGFPTGHVGQVHVKNVSKFKRLYSPAVMLAAYGSGASTVSSAQDVGLDWGRGLPVATLVVMAQGG